MHQSPADEFSRVVHLSDAKRAEMMRRLDELARGRAHAPTDEPLFQASAVRVTVYQPGGGLGRFLVSARSISSRGLWFLHCGFLHPGTRCVFPISRAGRADAGILGAVSWCEHIERGLHAVAVEFAEPVDPRLLIIASGIPAGDDRTQGTVPVLSGNVLVLDDQVLDRELLEYHLRATGLQLSHASSVEDAMGVLARGPFDLVICDLNLAEMTGEAAMVTLRRAGYAGPIIVLTGESSPRRLADVSNGGAFAVIEKPYKPAQLIARIAEAIRRSSVIKARNAIALSVTRDVPIYSALSNEPGMDGLIQRFITSTRELMPELQQCVARADFHAVRRICVSIKGSGAGFGFEPVTRAAGLAIDALDASLSIEEAAPALRDLQDVVARLRAREFPSAA